MSCQGCSIAHNYILADNGCNKHIRAVIMKVLQQAKVKRNYKLEWMKIDNDKFGLQPGEYLCLDWKSYLDYALDFVKTARIHKRVSQSVKVSDAVWKTGKEHRVKLPSFIKVEEIWNKTFCMDGIDRYFIKLKINNVMVESLHYENIAEILSLNLNKDVHVGKNNILWIYASYVEDLYVSCITGELVLVEKELVKAEQWQTVYEMREL
jgi:hypothetical protein